MAIHSFKSRVYWSDTDAARIAHFSSIFRFCEMAEESLFNERLGWRWSPRAGVMMPRVRAECDFHKPLHVHDEFRVDIVDILIGEKSITYRLEVHNETRGYKAATCSLVTVAVDPETIRPIPVPQDLRRRLLELGARERSQA
ncbi:MAG: acyl-CoA thioesterase [Desulfurococcales archaeon]|nr:acyl-CoA thioesterase [Desulfurococcales archaeon]